MAGNQRRRAVKPQPLCRRRRAYERIATAYGLNEIRYFNVEDRGRAELLAREMAATADWADRFETSDLSGSRFSAPLGHLEIWTSRR